jgi:hypothetical protein
MCRPPLELPPRYLATGYSKSFHWIVTPSVGEFQFGTLSVRTGPVPLEISWNETVLSGGELAPM